MIGRVSLVLAALAPCALPLAAACGSAQEPARPHTQPPTESHAEPQAERPAQRAPHVLRARLEFDTGPSRPVGVLAADLDGDGADELVTLLRGPGVLRVTSHLSNLPRRSPRHADFAIGDFAIGPVRVGAFEPGTPALVALAQRDDPALLVVDVRALFTGSGDPLVLRLPLDARPRAIASGDLGQDGVPDVVVATIDDEVLVVTAGAIAARFALVDEQPACLAIPQDGASILVGSQSARRITRYRASEVASYAPDGAGVELAGLPRRILEVDGWRGDPALRWAVAAGDHDLAWLDADLRVLRTERLASVPIHVDVRGAAPRRALLATSLHGQEARVEREGGASTTFYAGQHPVAGALGDYDGDGQLDVALANGDAKRVSLVFGRPDGAFELARLSPSGRSPHSLDAGDFDGDGRVDLAVLCALDGTLRLHPGGADGFGAGVDQGPAEGANRVRARDLDGDGKLDVAFLRETARGVVLDAWFGDGAGRLWQRGETAPLRCAGSPGDLLVLDLEGDGRLAALITDPAASKLVIVPLDASRPGSLAFGVPIEHALAGTPQDLAFVAREEGASLVAVTLSAAAPRRGFALLRVTRAAATEVLHQPATERPRGIAAHAETGAIAYLGGEDSTSTLIVFDRDAQGPGRVRREPRAGGLRAYAVRAADLDGNGHADFVVSAQNGHHLNLWLNAGGGVLRRMPDLGVGTGPLDLLVADVDGDGAPEIVTACAFSDEIAVID